VGGRRVGILRRESRLTPTTAALTLRKATLEDGPFLLRVRNADDVRLQSKNQELISGETHEKWLTQNLGDADSAIWIIERQQEKLGYIRARKLEQPGESGKWLLSIALDFSSRGRGYGTWAITEACRLLRTDYRAETIVAEVKNKNSVSLRVFTKMGFVPAANAGEQRGLTRLELSLRQ
jgi:RimJ/RimL family protein N-acetyltransferase